MQTLFEKRYKSELLGVAKSPYYPYRCRPSFDQKLITLKGYIRNAAAGYSASHEQSFTGGFWLEPLVLPSH